jgi:hypothetical protein
VKTSSVYYVRCGVGIEITYARRRIGVTKSFEILVGNCLGSNIDREIASEWMFGK